MLSHLDDQKQRLNKIKTAQIKADEEDSRSRRTATRCREPFFPVGRECFYVGKKEKLGWHEAKSACHRLQAHLAEPERPKALAKALKKIKGNFNRCWIGGSDQEEEGVWKWLSGGSLVGDRNWRPGQPSTYSLRGEEQDCLAILKNANGGPPLDDFSCWVDRAYICEADPEC
ncbi:hypothetical protein SK128_000324 [Halocaridina rubra]|uniref:C-type lectin domain-containing protein n=1 Tax=Halocaridina rubra TaxID=373956 RepID=A0AAN8WS41_HALRR